MAKISTQKMYNEIEYNERRLLVLLSNDLLWFRKNLENIKSHKNKKYFAKKKILKYNQIFKTTEELATLSNKITKTDSTLESSPYVYLEKEKLASQKINIKSDVNIKNLSKPKLFEVVVFTHYVDLFNNPKSRKYPKHKCIEIVTRKILDKGNNMPSSKLARSYYLEDTQNCEKIIKDMFIDSALYLKRDLEEEINYKKQKQAKMQQEAIESHKTITKPRKRKALDKEEKVVNKKDKTKATKQNKKTKVKYNATTQNYEHVLDDEQTM